MILALARAEPPTGLELEALGAARRLGEALGSPVARALVAGDGRGGVEGELHALAALAAELRPAVVCLPGDEWGLELGPRLAGRVGGTALTHVVDVEVRDGRPVWRRPVFGGKAVATVAALAEPVVAVLRPGMFEPAEAGAGAPEHTARAAGEGRVRLVGRTERAEEGVPLERARVIVSGGRGLGEAEGFRLLEELAGVLGGGVGASLAAVDEGWADVERQVGLTGKSVRPDLYVAVGISGASQHLAGIGGAKVVVAINSDADAPIFEAARLGVVMDYRELLPALVEELRRRLPTAP